MKVLLIVIDGASPRVVCPAVQTGRLPNLARLREAGEMHEHSVSIFPSITPAATASIVTGAYPAEHGIAGASWYDEASDEVAYYGDDFWVIAREGFGTFMRDFLLRLNGDRLTMPTVMEVCEGAGRPSGVINYLVYRGPQHHRVNVPWLMALLPGVPLAETVAGPAMLRLGDFVDSHAAKPRLWPRPGGLFHRFGMDDAATGAFMTDLASSDEWPEFTVAYFADNDYRSHQVGPVAALPVIEQVDAALGSVFDAAGGFERFMRDRCVVVTSDHGHCDIRGTRDEAVIELHKVLGDFTHAELGRPWQPDDDILVCPNMRAAQIYVHDPRRNVERVGLATLRDRRVDLAMWRSAHGDRDAAGYTVAGQQGRLSFWHARVGIGAARANGDVARDSQGTLWEWHGDLGVLGLERSGGVLESRDYPNAFERIAASLDHRRSGEVWVTAQPGCEFDVPGGHAHVGGGSHGALHALDSLSPVIVAGAPRALPRAMRLVDIAPLCLEALGVATTRRIGAPYQSTADRHHAGVGR